MEIEGRSYQGVLILQVMSRLVRQADGAVTIRGAVMQGLDAGSREFVLDLGRVESMDSSSLGDLIAAVLEVQRRGGIVKLVRVQPAVAGLLHITHLDSITDRHSDAASALRSLRGEAESVRPRRAPQLPTAAPSPVT